MSDTPGTAEGHGTDLNVPMDSTDRAAAGGESPDATDPAPTAGSSTAASMAGAIPTVPTTPPEIGAEEANGALQGDSGAPATGNEGGVIQGQASGADGEAEENRRSARERKSRTFFGRVVQGEAQLKEVVVSKHEWARRVRQALDPTAEWGDPSAYPAAKIKYPVAPDPRRRAVPSMTATMAAKPLPVVTAAAAASAALSPASSSAALLPALLGPCAVRRRGFRDSLALGTGAAAEGETADQSSPAEVEGEPDTEGEGDAADVPATRLADIRCTFCHTNIGNELSVKSLVAACCEGLTDRVSGATESEYAAFLRMHLGPVEGPFQALKCHDRWMHTRCADWSSVVTKSADGRHYQHLAVAFKHAQRVTCSQCHQVGATISCHGEECDRVYHLPCAWLLHLENQVDLYEPRRALCCAQHLHLGDELRARDSQPPMQLVKYPPPSPKKASAKARPKQMKQQRPFVDEQRDVQGYIDGLVTKTDSGDEYVEDRDAIRFLHLLRRTVTVDLQLRAVRAMLRSSDALLYSCVRCGEADTLLAWASRAAAESQTALLDAAFELLGRLPYDAHTAPSVRRAKAWAGLASSPNPAVQRHMAALGACLDAGENPALAAPSSSPAASPPQLIDFEEEDEPMPDAADADDPAQDAQRRRQRLHEAEQRVLAEAAAERRQQALARRAARLAAPQPTPEEQRKARQAAVQEAYLQRRREWEAQQREPEAERVSRRPVPGADLTGPGTDFPQQVETTIVPPSAIRGRLAPKPVGSEPPLPPPPSYTEATRPRNPVRPPRGPAATSPRPPLPRRARPPPARSTPGPPNPPRPAHWRQRAEEPEVSMQPDLAPQLSPQPPPRSPSPPKLEPSSPSPPTSSPPPTPSDPYSAALAKAQAEAPAPAPAPSTASLRQTWAETCRAEAHYLLVAAGLEPAGPPVDPVLAAAQQQLDDVNEVLRTNLGITPEMRRHLLPILAELDMRREVDRNLLQGVLETVQSVLGRG
eukprot:EG_transcript_1605